MKKNKDFRIALSINGEGKGHITRMTALAQRLKAKYNLVFWCSGSCWRDLEKAFPGSRIHLVPSLHFVTQNFELDYLKTTLVNIKNLISSGFLIENLMEELKAERIDGIISDFEPFLPEAGSRLNLPIIQLNHPGVVTRIWDSSPDAFIARIIAGRMMSKFDKEIICSFYEGDIGPILRNEIIKAKRYVRKGNYFLVYEKEAFSKALRNILSGFPKEEFRFFPNPKEDFLASLAGCRGIIASSGHQIISEALYLQKPIFVIPLKNQYEQRLNAEMLKKSGWGDFGYPEDFSKELKGFIQDIDTFPRPVKTPFVLKTKDDSKKAVLEISDFFSKALKGREKKGYLKVPWYIPPRPNSLYKHTHPVTSSSKAV